MKKMMLISLIALTSLSVFSQTLAKPDLRLVAGITGENGLVALQDGRISMFSSKNIGIIHANNRKVIFINNEAGVVSLGFKNSSWEQTKAHLDLSAASAPAMCDRLNQINIASIEKKVANALPKGAKIKIIKSVGEFVCAIYSISNNTVRYDIQIALLEHGKLGGFNLIKSDKVTEYGAFCGLRDAGDNNLFLIVDEPAGSSDYLAVYVYSLAG